MSKAIPKECMALLKEASEMFSETGCVPGIDGEEVPAETIVPEAKEYISETIDDPESNLRSGDWGSSPLGSANDFSSLAPKRSLVWPASPTFLQWTGASDDRFEVTL